ncbi:type VII secretion protein EccB [Pseudonocardia eucalypti]|uniref:Type VII secretion protein EccB n=1 Tax=Pseudonocardia eucalypti TaxID=648755 RepID=A0ABP9PLP0_9PSEU|nr:type VII secretion protein EccB [Pseudonocardia eucalypti]
MAREPVTRVQLDAYRFGQRRLESALARRDPVPLHEELRGQRRVVATGMALGMVALLGAVLVSMLFPKPRWNIHEVVAGKQSGRMFAVIHNPDRLVPVTNLAAARLVRFAAEKANAGGGAAGGPSTGEPKQIDDAVLDQAPRTAPAAVPGAIAALPVPNAREGMPRGPWVLCDTDGRSVLVADATPAPKLDGPDALLLTGGGRDYLVMGGLKHAVESTEARSAYGLADVPARAASETLLDVIPTGVPLTGGPRPQSAGQRSAGLPGRQVGDVVRVVRPGQGDAFYLVLMNGVQEVGEPVANLLRAANGADRSRPPDSLRAEEINAAPRSKLAGVESLPRLFPRIAPETATVCLRWNGRLGEILAGKAPPLPERRTMAPLSQQDGAGPKLDAVAFPAKTALVACAVARESDCQRPRRGGERVQGALWLLSETGAAYPVANTDTADALGIAEAIPVPVEALRLLPTGSTLDVAQAQRTVDVLVAQTN